MERIIKLNVTLGKNFQQYELPVDGNMPLIDFFPAVRKLLLEVYPEAQTYDFYTTEFERLAMVSKDDELYISDNCQTLGAVIDLIDEEIDTIEVIALGNKSVKEVLEEEAQLDHALKHYDENKNESD